VIPWTFERDRLGSVRTGFLSTVGGGSSLRALPSRWVHLADVWAAVAMSGAAFSPAMGKMTRPVRGLLALGNLRLGVWCPNPLRIRTAADSDWYERHHPRPWYLAKELLGIHRLTDRWIYVTDGGHYDNLGLVELLSRGCTEIYCFDAAGDSSDTFGTLADAMRIARVRYGIEIDLDTARLKADKDGVSEAGVGAGLIRYPGGGEGWIVLAKLCVPKTAPFDIVDLARTLPAFPNHPTADQLYTDQKFEAYRALGHHLGERAVAMAARIVRHAPREGLATAVEWANTKG
jgi:hypothetical protein